MTPDRDVQGQGGGVGVIGVDLQEHRDVAQSLKRFGDNYLTRVLGTQERREVPREQKTRWLAGRFAAKEAVFKTLGVGPQDELSWTGIEIVKGPGGGPTVLLGPRAQYFARRNGLIHVDVSITHTATVAAACAFGTRKTSERGLRSINTPDPLTVMSGEISRRMKMSERTTLENQIREVLADQGHLTQDAESLGVDDNLYTAGMSSHASVNLMLGLEDELDIEFPEDKLTKQTFSSISAIADAVEEITND